DSHRRPQVKDASEFQRLLSRWHDVRPRLAELATKVRELKQPPKEALAAWRTDLVRVTRDLRLALKDQLRGTDMIARPRVVGRSAAHKPPAAEPATEKSTLTNEQIVKLLDQRDHESKHNGEAHAPS